MLLLYLILDAKYYKDFYFIFMDLYCAIFQV
jgi:hypothetical protein